MDIQDVMELVVADPENTGNIQSAEAQLLAIIEDAGGDEIEMHEDSKQEDSEDVDSTAPSSVS
jgi:hypothetical protein